VPTFSIIIFGRQASSLLQSYLFLHLFEMTDFEDDMDVDGLPPYDGPPPYRSIQFSSDNTTAKGKRIVADLPVEAEDNLPWCVVSVRSESSIC
jgi:hypothetical protein